MIDIPGYEGLYAVTSCGKVWSYRSNRFIGVHYNKGGYQIVSLYYRRKQKAFLLHRLVASAYVSNPNGFNEVNHMDENKSNNFARNLEWCDHKYNSNYGTRKKRISEIKAKKLICLETGKTYNSTREAANDFGISRASICNYCNGKYNSRLGLHFRYIEKR